VISNILYLAKNYPTPKAKINPASLYDKNGRFTPTKEEQKMIDILDKLFSDSDTNRFTLKQVEDSATGDECEAM